MKERPIPCTSEEVRAILAGNKTQARRVIKDQPAECQSLARDCASPSGYSLFADAYEDFHLKCPYGVPGDRLLVAMEIPGEPEKYCAGSDGKIYSKARGHWRPLIEFFGAKGYKKVTLSKGPRKETKNVHRLVCMAFYGLPEPGSEQVRHLDGNKENCLPSNLCWGSQAENWQDRKAHGNGIEGEKHHASKFSDLERGKIRWAIDKGLCSQRQAARALGVSQASVQQICKGLELIEPEVTVPEYRISRILLEITDIRVERVRGISHKDAIAEGAKGEVELREEHLTIPQHWFANQWNSINEAKGFGWDQNPWCWCISFEVIKP